MATDDNAVSGLILGPMLRYVSETEATIWVETDRACQVEILGRRAQTFEVAGHHYGLVVIDGLEPGSEHEYQVSLDGAVQWPVPDGGFPASVLRTLDPGRPVRLAFGSCRAIKVAPRRRPARAAQADPAHVDALAACALTLRETTRDEWPDVLLMIGDQVYADNPGPDTRAFIARRRDPASLPVNEVADFEEYCALYREAWSDPLVRWLLSVVPTAMIFDDHDVHDDWNISGAWRREYGAKPWWRSRIEGAYMSYWIYQHLGNLSPAELGADEIWGQVRRGQRAEVLRDLARRADERAPGIRWSFRRTFGKVRVVVVDSRSRRVVDEGKRLMTDEGEWQWVTESVSGDWEHVVLATSVPPLLPRGIHALEAWNEAVSDGVWGKRFSRFGERLRQAFDLEHWPAFGASFVQLEQLLTGLATGAHGEPPASLTIISGDIHHSYLAAVDLPAGTHSRTAIYEAVCSPFHQTMPPIMQRGQRLASTKTGGLIGAALARLAGAVPPAIRWRITRGPWFENTLATLEYGDRAASVRFDRTTDASSGSPRLTSACETRLS
jgi:PhoD-like phosphatase